MIFAKVADSNDIDGRWGILSAPRRVENLETAWRRWGLKTGQHWVEVYVKV